MIGVFGGTFDPVHFGHLRPALEVQQTLQLKQLRLVPCGVAPHRGRPIASKKQRAAMLKLAIADQTELVVDERELGRDGPSYTVDTLLSLRQEFVDTPLCLIVGMDTFQTLPGWHHWEELPELAHIVVMMRPGSDVVFEGVLKELVIQRQVMDLDRLYEQAGGYVFFCEVSQLDISASIIRTQVAGGRSPRYLLPEAVLRYIQHEGLYK